MDKKRIAYCGIDCSICPVYVATQKHQEKARIRIAKLWSDENHEYEACEITCKGCREPWGKKFQHCQDCAVRACARKKLIKTCAECEEYPCDKLNKLHKSLDKKIARINLDHLCNNCTID
nr:DUF3795 domain-containing protein [uncultured Marinifilum sp.]